MPIFENEVNTDNEYDLSKADDDDYHELYNNENYIPEVQFWKSTTKRYVFFN